MARSSNPRARWDAVPVPEAVDLDTLRDAVVTFRRAIGPIDRADILAAQVLADPVPGTLLLVTTARDHAGRPLMLDVAALLDSRAQRAQGAEPPPPQWADTEPAGMPE